MTVIDELLNSNYAFRNSIRFIPGRIEDNLSLEVTEETFETETPGVGALHAHAEIQTEHGFTIASMFIKELYRDGEEKPFQVEQEIRATDNTPVVFGLDLFDKKYKYMGPSISNMTTRAISIKDMYDENGRIISSSARDIAGSNGTYEVKWEYSACEDGPVVETTQTYTPHGGTEEEKQVIRTEQIVYFEKTGAWEGKIPYQIPEIGTPTKRPILFRDVTESYDPYGEVTLTHRSVFDVLPDSKEEGSYVNTLSYEYIQEYENGQVVHQSSYELEDSNIEDNESWFTYDANGEELTNRYIERTGQQQTDRLAFTREDVSILFTYGDHGQTNGINFKTYENLDADGYLERSYSFGDTHVYDEHREDIKSDTVPRKMLQYNGGVLYSSDDYYIGDGFTNWNGDYMGDGFKDSEESREKIEKLIDGASAMVENDLICETDNMRVFVTDNPIAVFAHTSPETGRTVPAVVALDTKSKIIFVSMKDPAEGRLAGKVLGESYAKTWPDFHKDYSMPHCNGIASAEAIHNGLPRGLTMLTNTAVGIEKAINPPQSIDDHFEFEKLEAGIFTTAHNKMMEQGLAPTVFENEHVNNDPER